MKSLRHFVAYIFGDYPELLFKLNFFRVNHLWLNTSSPKCFYDKIAFMAFHTDTTQWSLLADKIGVRQYVKDKGYGDNLPEVYGIWESPSDVDFDSLPDRFVLKTNNASGTNLIVSDKSTIDENEIRSKFEKWIKWNYGRETAQPHYCRIKPKIFAEEFLSDDETTAKGKQLIDYKFFCFDGVPQVVHLMKDREGYSHTVKVQFYDMDWNPHPEYVIHDEVLTENIPEPISFDLMKKMAASLSEGFPFVRVDLYQINGKPYLGEMSFTPGIESFSPIMLKKFGEMLKID